MLNALVREIPIICGLCVRSANQYTPLRIDVNSRPLPITPLYRMRSTGCAHGHGNHAQTRDPFAYAAWRGLYLLTLTRFLRAEIFALWANGALAKTLSAQ